MAYITQEEKKAIAKKLKGIVPKGWKYSLRIQHHTTLIMTIKEAPADLVGEDYVQINSERSFEGTEYYETFKEIFGALNTDNHDNSDIYTDYFDVGHYVWVHIGSWDKPFVNTEQDRAV